MKCPIDGTDLVISDRQGIEIDYCPQCRGVWLDRGELDKIIERSVQYLPPSDDKTYGTVGEGYHPADPYYQKRKKRKGFLGDLFDFD